MKGKILIEAIAEISKLINDYAYKCAGRQESEYFSRAGGKIGFVNMVMVALNFVSKSIQAELNDFFERVRESKERARKQAYSAGRYKLTVAAFKMLFDRTAELASTSFTDLATFKGYRPCAIDGSTICLENTYVLREHYGVLGSGDGCAGGRISIACDVLNNGILLDALIGKLEIGERVLALQHAKRISELGVANPLLIFDRGYASAEMFEALGDTAFLFRLKRRFSQEMDSLPIGDHEKSFKIGKKVFRLRVVKFGLSTGEIETLVTNLPGKNMSLAELKELYGLRWGVETAYRTIKSHLELENFTGTTQLIVEQDFYATMFLKNMVAFAKIDTDGIIRESENPNNKYRQKTNENMLIGILKDELAIALLDPNPRTQADRVNAIIFEAVQHTIPIRPDRHFQHRRRHSSRFNISAKLAH